MEINYSIANYSKYLLHFDIGVQQGIRHIGLFAFGENLGLSVKERVCHLALGILKMLPVLGHLAAAIDWFLHANHITQLKIDEVDPYQRGRIFGTAYREKTQVLYRTILKSLGGLKEGIRAYEQTIPEHLKQEMRGLAEGADVPYEDVLSIHIFLDEQPGRFGCSALAQKDGRRVALANHRVADEACAGESRQRRQSLLNSLEQSPQKILQSSGVDSTIQSIVFNPSARSIQLSSMEQNASFGSMQTASQQQLFGENKTAQEATSMLLMRNLDWPWYFLGQNTVLLTRIIGEKKVCTVTFPGYLGALSGMNEDGFCLAVCVQGRERNRNGIPNPLLFADLLGKCSTVKEAALSLNATQHGSSINLILADPREARSLELDGRIFEEVGNI